MEARWLDRAIELAAANVEAGGGPFGAVLVRDGVLVAEAVNRVTPDCDPTAHAEIACIRAACRRLGHFELAGCELYSSCEPCPMCLGAVYWSRLDRVYYAATRHDAAAAGFDDEFIYREFASGVALRRVPLERVSSEGATEPFRRWLARRDRVAY